MEEGGEGSLKLLKHRLQLKEVEIEQLKFEMNTQKDKYITLEKDYMDLKTSYSLALKNEKNIKALTDTIENMEKDKQQILDELRYKETKFNQKIREMQLKFEKEQMTMKNIHDSMVNKMESVNAIERLCDRQQQQIKIYEEKFVQMKQDNDELIKLLQVKHEMKFTDLKKKMMDHIKETQKNVTQLNIEHMDVSSKLTLLQNHQLLVELDYQSQQIEELLKRKEALEKTVFELKRDIEIHKEVELTLSEKNKKLSEMLKNLSNNRDINLNNTRTSFDNGSTTNQININSNIREFNIYSTSHQRIAKLEKEIKMKKNEYDLLKVNFDNLETKLNCYERRHYNIFHLFESVLKRICEDETLIEHKDVFIDIDSIRKDEFEALGVDQKYSLVVIIMKMLLPLIDNSFIETALLNKLDADRNKMKNIHLRINETRNNFFKATSSRYIDLPKMNFNKAIFNKTLNKNSFSVLNS